MTALPSRNGASCSTGVCPVLNSGAAHTLTEKRTMTESTAEPSEPPRFDLAAAFRARQDKLEADLGLGRAVAGHPGTMGDATELDWRAMLENFLPRRYGVAKAFVVDVHGHRSEQLDVVIHDRHFSPLFFDVGGAHYIPAESVYAVFEIKQQTTKAHIEYAGKKVASVRRLHRTSVGFMTANGRATARQPPRILSGLLTLSSGWTPPHGEPLHDALRARVPEEVLDLGIALRAGAFEAPNPQHPGQLAICADPNAALIFLVLRLLKRLQDMATIGAMDLDQYTQAVCAPPPADC